MKNSKQNKKKKFLDTFGTNLTNKAKNNELDIVIGRDKEIQRIVQIFQLLNSLDLNFQKLWMNSLQLFQILMIQKIYDNRVYCSYPIKMEDYWMALLLYIFSRLIR